MKKNKGRPRVTKIRMTVPLDEITVVGDKTYEIFEEMAKLDDKKFPERFEELERQFEESWFKDYDENVKNNRPDYNEHDWADEQIKKSIRKEYARNNIIKSKEDIEDLASAVWCRILINANYSYMEPKSHKGRKIKMMVQNEIIDQYRYSNIDYSKQVVKAGIKDDLIHNGIITKTQINNFIKSLVEGKLVFYLNSSSKSEQAKCIDLQALRNSDFTNLVVTDRNAKREPFLFPVVSAAKAKSLTAIEIENYKPAVKPKKVTQNANKIKPKKGEYKQFVPPDPDED